MLYGQPNSGHLRSVTYVSEHVLPMSSVQRLTRRGISLTQPHPPIQNSSRNAN
jgi:hypothetical protein